MGENNKIVLDQLKTETKLKQIKQQEDGSDLPGDDKDKMIKIERDWSEIPKDIGELIIPKLYLVDRLEWSMVCQNWKNLLEGVPYSDIQLFPWLFCFTSQWTEISLVDPSTGRSFALDLAVISNNKHLFRHARPCASNYGWVLFSRPKHMLGTDSVTDILFLYSPFTFEVIELPELVEHNDAASFSLSMNSPDCIVFVLSPKYLNYCRPGDKIWKKILRIGPNGSDFTGLQVLDMASFVELLYCYFKDGLMVLFNGSNQEVKLLPHKEPQRNEDFGSLTLASTGYPILTWKSGECWGFESSRNEWIKDSSLENHTIFVSRPCFSVPATGTRKQRLTQVSKFEGSFRDPCPYLFNIVECERRFKLYQLMLSQNPSLEKIWIQPPLQVVWRACDLLKSISVPVLEHKGN